MMNGLGKSDRPVVPEKSLNKTGQPVAEGMEGRGLAKGNLPQQNASRTPSRNDAHSALERVRQAAGKDKKLRFTALLHHIRTEEGTPQGGSASPLLANVYLHYVFDLWVQAWRQKRAHGDVIVVRFADDIVVGFNSKADADQFRAELTERMRKFHLELHPEKTRLLEFGPQAINQRRWRGEGKPETFNFLGFTHICVKKRSNGRFTVLRQTMRKRLQTKLNEVKAELQRRRHEPIPEVGKWLQAVVRGHIRYYGVPRNQNALWIFRFQVGRLWHRALSRRSQNGRVLWDRMRRLITRWLPPPSVCHPYPLRRMGVITKGKSRMDAGIPLVRIRGGGCVKT
jgi:RNA-directed DNA polymerase